MRGSACKSDKAGLIEFITRDNRVPLVATLITVVLFFGTMRADTGRNTDDIRELKSYREEDHNTLKDVQGDVKAILAKMGDKHQS